MPNPTTPTLSSCHQAQIGIITSDEGTNYYICTECGQPCDPYIDDPGHKVEIIPTSEDNTPWEVTILGGENNIKVHLKHPKNVAEVFQAIQAIEVLGRTFGQELPTSEDELEQILSSIEVAITFKANMLPRFDSTLSEAKAALQAREHRLAVEAQTNAVAWTIGQIDEMHMREGASNEADRLFKGIKNNLRDSYESEIGVDPAPSYPMRAELAKTGPQLNVEEKKK